MLRMCAKTAPRPQVWGRSVASNRLVPPESGAEGANFGPFIHPLMNSRLVPWIGKLIILSALGINWSCAAVAQGNRALLRARGVQLVLGDKPFRNVGANMPDLFERFLHDEDTETDKALAEARDAGIRFARCFGSTWGPGDFHIFEEDSPRWLRAFDRMLAASERHGISLVPSLLFNADMLPGYVRAKTGRDERIVDLLTPGSASNRIAVKYVTTIVSRYKGDPRILFWEIGNEYNLDADLSAQWKKRPANQIPTSDQERAFLAQIAALIKRLDPVHLVTSGNSDMRPYAWHIRQSMLAQRDKEDRTNWPMDWRKDTFPQYVEMLRFFNPPPIDLISVHDYPLGNESPLWLPADDTKAGTLRWSRTASDRLRLPLFVGEFGTTVYDSGSEQRSSWFTDFLEQMRGGAAPIAAVWTWEYKSDDPQQGRMALSPRTTPELTRLLADVNRVLALPAK